MTDAALQAIRERLPEYVETVTTKSKGGFYTCPLCGSGTGPNKSGAFKVQGEKWHCFSCGKSGDVLDLLGEIERIPDFRDRARRAEELFGDGGVTATAAPVRREPKLEPEPTFIPHDLANRSLTAYERNDFCRWLARVFGNETAFRLADMYHIGTSKFYDGACIFWQQDIEGNIRGGKIMAYDRETGRRIKEPHTRVTWVHRAMKIEPYNLKQCLFGLHLAASSSKPVAVVESEKSAIIGAGVRPEAVWMATGGKGTLNRAMLEPLQGRRVVLFPDLGAYDDWTAKAKGWPGVEVSDVLERRASAEDRAAGLDVADFLLRENEAIGGRSGF
ncbi:MAG: hypothetical protein HGB06_04035 [Chlorobaculum sp.]|jgi:hypothetical protein|nr:hypothetical protein [Chlorobaculum sp.]